MDRMDWLSRNAEFLSPDSITNCLIAYKDLYNFDNIPDRMAYVKAIHGSNAVLTVVNQVHHTKGLMRDEETNSKLAILLSILEPLLVND